MPTRLRLRLRDWPLRLKLAALLALASLIPLAVSATLDVRDARARSVAATTALLAARADELVGELDTFHRGYAQAATRLAKFPTVVDFCHRGDGGGSLAATAQALLDVWPSSDANIRGVALRVASFACLRVAQKSGDAPLRASGAGPAA